MINFILGFIAGGLLVAFKDKFIIKIERKEDSTDA